MDKKKAQVAIIGVGNCAKLTLGHSMPGPLIAPSSYFMKTPPKQLRDNIARDMTEAFIQGDETK